MKKYIAWFLVLLCVLGLIGCSSPSNEDITGTIKFYSEATKEFTTPVSSTSMELSKAQAEEIKRILHNVTEWVDDHSVDRLAYYFDGEFQLSDSEFVYYFTYEYDVIYYDHYIGKITAEEMQFIKSIQGTEPFGKTRYTYDELFEMSAKELLDLFIQNGLVINDDLKASYTEEELQNLFKENFDLWHTGVSAHSHTTYCDLAEQTKVIYDKITECTPSTNALKEIPGATTFIVDILDRAKEEQLACADAIEKFYEDDTNEYYFSCIKSHYIIVMDNTGRTIDIVTALNEGLATIADLDYYGIQYYVEPKEQDNSNLLN